MMYGAKSKKRRVRDKSPQQSATDEACTAPGLIYSFHLVARASSRPDSLLPSPAHRTRDALMTRNADRVSVRDEGWSGAKLEMSRVGYADAGLPVANGAEGVWQLTMLDFGL